MKRILSILTLILALTFSFTFTSCKKDKDNPIVSNKEYIKNFLADKGKTIYFRTGSVSDIYGDYIAVIDSVSGQLYARDTFSVDIKPGTDQSNAIWTTNSYDQTILLTQSNEIIQYSGIGDSSEQVIDILGYIISGDSVILEGIQYNEIPTIDKYHKIVLIKRP